MKQKWMLLLVLLLTAGMAKAQWDKPDPVAYKVTEITPSDDENGAIYHLYAVQYEAFYTQGNQWNSEATLSNTIETKKFFFSPYKADGVNWDGATYRMNNWVTNKSIWDHVFVVNSGGYDYVASDCTMGPGKPCRGDDFWCLEWTEDGLACIYMSDQSATRGETALGYKAYMATTDYPNNTRVGLTIPQSSNLEFADVIEWAVVDAAAYGAANAIYTKAQELAQAIAAAEEGNPGIDMAAPKAVYDNTASTLSQLQAAIDAIPAIVRQYAIDKAAGASVANPANMTGLIVLPSYDADATTAQGWTGKFDGISGSCGQIYNMVDSFNFRQTITNLPNGIYRINVQGLWRAAYANNPLYQTGVLADPLMERAYVYGQSGPYRLRHKLMGLLEGASSEMIHELDSPLDNGMYAPNRTAGFTMYAERGEYSHNETYVMVTDGTLTLGLYSDFIPYDHAWCVFDNWTLEYLGTGADARELLVEQVATSFVADDTKVEAQLVETYEELLEGMSELEGEELAQYASALYTLQDVMLASQAAFENYLSTINGVKTYLAEHPEIEGPDRVLLEEYLESSDEPGKFPRGGSIYIIEDLPLTIAELEEEVAYVLQLQQNAVQNSISEGTDITSLLVNPNLAKSGYEGWDFWAAVDGKCLSGEGLPEWPVGQAYQSAFYIQQTLQNMPDGIYELNVNAFFRWGGDWAGQDEKAVPVVIYINEFNTPIQNITSEMVNEDTGVDMENCYITNPGTWPYDNVTEREGKKWYAPNSVTGASYAFRAGRYKQTVYGLVTDGKLTLGMRDDRTSSTEWTVLSNMRLTYQAKNPDAMEAVMEDLLKKAETHCTAATAEGAGYSMEYYNDIQDLANEFQAEADEEAKYEKLIAINDHLKLLVQSTEVYRRLVKVLDMAYSAYWDGLDTDYTQEDITTFETSIYNPITEALLAGELNIEQAEVKIAEVGKLEAVDRVYVYGDLVNQAWGVIGTVYPLKRQADGTYQGEFESLDRTADGGYGNRSGVYFGYQGQLMSSDDATKRTASGVQQSFGITGNGNTNWIATYGGRWKATVSANRDSVTIEPVGAALYPATVYVVGDIAQGYWKHANNVPMAHKGNGRYSGIVNIGETDGRFTIFAGGWSLAQSNWNEARLGTAPGDVDLPLGEPVAGVGRFHASSAWRVPAGTYVVELDFPTLSLTVTPLEMAGNGTPTEPYMVNTLADLQALSSLLKPNTTNYVSLNADIDMAGVDNWMPICGNPAATDLVTTLVSFNGRNHVIKNFHGTSSFFGTLVGDITNVGFDNAHITGAGIVADSFGHPYCFSTTGLRAGNTLRNVWVQGSLVAQGECAGALAGTVYSYTNLSNCYSRVDITGEATYMGGMLGRVLQGIDANHCYAAGSVASGNGFIGGGQTETTEPSSYVDMVVWNNANANFGPFHAGSSIEAPQADLLDVVFDADGTAHDASPMQNVIEKVGNPIIEPNIFTQGNAARFTSGYGEVPENYYRVNYAGNQKMIDALSDGHSMEVFFNLNYDRFVDKEVKPFCATQGGGMGFLVSSASTGYKLSFICDVESSYKWTRSSLTPNSGQYYHMVAVWDKEKGEQRLYVNGNLHATAPAEGELTLPANDISRWFCIGGDPGTDKAQSGANFQILAARVYDQPLSEKQAYDLYTKAQSANATTYASDLLRNVSYFDGTNHSNLQQTVVGWDTNLWTCQMEPGFYPVFVWDTTGGNSIEQVKREVGTDEFVQIYGIDGSSIYAGQLGKVELKPGLYVISSKNKSYKVSVK